MRPAVSTGGLLLEAIPKSPFAGGKVFAELVWLQVLIREWVWKMLKELCTIGILLQQFSEE
jgi:hypothetical protein